MEYKTQVHLEELLLAFRREVASVCKRDGINYELTFSQVEIFHLIKEHQRVTMKQIAEHLKITPPSATALVSEMEKRGLVERKGDTVDRRIIHIVFTPKAKKILDKLAGRKQTILSTMVSKLSLEDQKTLERIISILLKK